MQTFTPIQYLKIDIASNFGLDKENWDVRLDWFDEHEADLENMVLEADEPALFFAGVKAYRKAVKGQAIQYPISLDATASGAQILALLSGCERSAMLSNVLPSKDRLDLYTEVTKLLNQYSADDVNITRQDAKDAIMPSFYGSTKAPKEVFGEGELYETFQKVMSIACPGIWVLNSLFLDLWDSNAIKYDWVLPDNFHAGFKVKGEVQHEFTFFGIPHVAVTKEQMPQENGKALGANIIHSVDGMVVREMVARCNYDPDQVAYVRELALNKAKNIKSKRIKDQQLFEICKHARASGFLSVRVLDLIDEHNIGIVDSAALLDLINSLPEKPFEIITIHDCFRVHPNYANDLRHQYNTVLSALASSDLLNFIIGQLGAKHVTVPDRSALTASAKVAEYALS